MENRASGYDTVPKSKAILGASRVHKCLYFCRIKIQVSKIGVSLALDFNQTSYGTLNSDPFQMFQQALQLKKAPVLSVTY